MNATQTLVKTPPVFALACALACVILVGCQEQEAVQKSSNTTPASPPTTDLLAGATYVDDALCADCHVDIMATYQHVAMAKSFYDFDPDNLIESFEQNEYYHALSDNHYQMNVVDGQFELTRFKKRADGTRFVEHRQKAQYVVGSGKHVRTYVYRNDNGEMFQLPVVWYSQDKKWGMAPGYDSANHRDFLRPISRQCMFCHNAYPEIEPGSDAFGMPHRFPEKMPQGIGCQRCHGPGSEHVRISNESDENPNSAEQAAIRNSIVNSARLSPQLQDDVCNQCHFQPMSQRTSFIRKFGQHDFGFRPGQALQDFMVHFEPDRDNQQADHFEINHHPYRLYQSSCFLKSENGIRCTHCHDPHSIVAKVDRPRHYRKKCFACHGKNDCLNLKQGRLPDADCVACHMPTRRTTDVIHVTMTDHKIDRRSQLTDPLAPLNEIDVPAEFPVRKYEFAKRTAPDGYHRIYEYFTRVQDEDDTATPLLEKTIERQADVHDTAKLQLAQRLLQQKEFERAENIYQRINGPSNSYIHTNIAISHLGQGNNEIAIERLVQASQSDPLNPSAWYNLGLAYANTNQNQLAISAFETAVKLRPNYVKARNKLGSQYAITDQLELAKVHFESAISIDARYVEGYRKLAAVYKRLGDWTASIATLKDGLSIDENHLPLVESLTFNLLDPQNTTALDNKAALTRSSKLVENEKSNVDYLLLQSLALLKNRQPERCLDVLKKILPTKKRKPEAGIVLAITQQQLGSIKSAEENFTNALAALKSGQLDKLSRLIESIGRQAFE